MRLGTLFVTLLGLTVAAPAFAQPVIVAGAAPEQAASAAQPECVVAPTGAASAEIRCRVLPTAGGQGSEMTFLVSARTAPTAARCAGADVVRLPGAPRKPHPDRPLVVKAASESPCGA